MALDKFNPQAMKDDHLLPATLLEVGDTLNFIETRKHTLRNEIKASRLDASGAKFSAIGGMAGGAGLLILSNPLGSLFVAGGAICYGVAVFSQWLQTGKVQIMPLSSKTQAERDIELSSSTETGNAYDVAAIQGQRDSIREDAAYLSDREKVEYELLHFSPEGLLSAMNHVHPTQRWACYQFLIDAFLAGTIQSYFANPQALRDVLGNPQIYTSHLPEASKRFPEYGLQSAGAIEGEKARSSFQPVVGSNTQLNAISVESSSSYSDQPFTLPVASPESKLFDWNKLNAVYDDFPHLMLLGKTGAGKSFLAEVMGRFLDGNTIVITPKKKPKDFTGMQVVGIPYNFAAIVSHIEALSTLVKNREAEMNETGNENFSPVNVILDEVPTFVAGCKELGFDVVKDLKFIIRAGRTSKVRLILLAQGQEVKTLGFEGEGSLRDNLNYVYLKGFAEKHSQEIKVDVSQYDRPCIIDGQVADISQLIALAEQRPKPVFQPVEAAEPPKEVQAPSNVIYAPFTSAYKERKETVYSPCEPHEVDEDVTETNSSLDEIRSAFPEWEGKAKTLEVASLVVDFLRRQIEPIPASRIKSDIRGLKEDKALPTERLKILLTRLAEKGLVIELNGRYSAVQPAIEPNGDDYDF